MSRTPPASGAIRMKRRSRSGVSKTARRDPSATAEEQEATLLDLVDNVLNKGLTLTGDVVLSLADVDLVYLRFSALLCAADRVLPAPPRPAKAKRLLGK